MRSFFTIIILLLFFFINLFTFNYLRKIKKNVLIRVWIICRCVILSVTASGM